MKEFKKTTPWCYGKGGDTVLRFTYGFTCFDGQAPYFSINGEEWMASKTTDLTPKGRDAIACGCLHDYFPKAVRFLRQAVPFHLYSYGKGPMHYIANAEYRHKQALGEFEGTIHDPLRDSDFITRKTPWELFQGAVLWGVLTTDDAWEMESVKRMGPETLRVWLESRLVELDKAFVITMSFCNAGDLLVEATAYHAENSG